MSLDPTPGHRRHRHPALDMELEADEEAIGVAKFTVEVWSGERSGRKTTRTTYTARKKHDERLLRYDFRHAPYPTRVSADPRWRRVERRLLSLSRTQHQPLVCSRLLRLPSSLQPGGLYQFTRTRNLRLTPIVWILQGIARSLPISVLKRVQRFRKRKSQNAQNDYNS